MPLIIKRRLIIKSYTSFKGKKKTYYKNYKNKIALYLIAYKYDIYILNEEIKLDVNFIIFVRR